MDVRFWKLFYTVTDPLVAVYYAVKANRGEIAVALIGGLVLAMGVVSCFTVQS